MLTSPDRGTSRSAQAAATHTGREGAIHQAAHIWVPVGAHAAVRALWDLNRQLSGANDDPDDAWRAAAQRAA
ncbi:hypothetical protein TPAR_06370 [Tolypocladium paradoxum]|uniref:Uncharacterized protein n=1 Tax=Tolypocladium paradoxum TaxID=94208 RepID=A0A2S4KTF1_9HYPO|nr:hypothetical protein TPAR_06370 [Tolypocladium paradoxum]